MKTHRLILNHEEMNRKPTNKEEYKQLTHLHPISISQNQKNRGISLEASIAEITVNTLSTNNTQGSPVVLHYNLKKKVTASPFRLGKAEQIKSAKPYMGAAYNFLCSHDILFNTL